MSGTRHLVLDNRQILQKIRRMAYEIVEDHFEHKQILVVGIDGQGYALALRLIEELQTISHLEVKLGKISVNKASPTQAEITTDFSLDSLEKQSVILVDDVLYTGRTLAYSLRPFLLQPIASLRIAVLINRSHTVFPIQPTYTGYELATTLTDHIEVVLSNEDSRVSLV